MTDYMTTPAAGWYTDPSNPAQERWWGGVEWTNDVRPLAAPAPATAPPVMTQPAAAAQPFAAQSYATQPVAAQPYATQPVAAQPFAGQPFAAQPTAAQTFAAQPTAAQVPGGGINPFAALDAQAGLSGIGSGDFGMQATASTDSFGGSYGGFGAYGTGSGAPTSGIGTVDPGWYAPTQQTGSYGEPKNGVATAGLVLGLLGFGLVAIIVSVIGLRKARDFELQGDAPVGRKRSRWGVGLGILSLLTILALTLGSLFFYQTIYNYFTQLSGIAAETDNPQGGYLDNLGLPDVATGTEVTDGTYNRASYEQSIREEYAANEYPAPDSVTCPDQGSTEAGSTIVCTIVTGDMTESRTTQYLGDGNYSTMTIVTS